MDLKPFHHRLAELQVKRNTLGACLTNAEEKEMDQCLDLHVAYMRKQAEIFNLSLMASNTNDVEWQHQLCAKLDQL